MRTDCQAAPDTADKYVCRFGRKFKLGKKNQIAEIEDVLPGRQKGR